MKERAALRLLQGLTKDRQMDCSLVVNSVQYWCRMSEPEMDWLWNGEHDTPFHLDSFAKTTKTHVSIVRNACAPPKPTDGPLEVAKGLFGMTADVDGCHRGADGMLA